MEVNMTNVNLPAPRAIEQVDLLRLADDFLSRSAALIDKVAPPPWEDEDDLFDGEVFEEEEAEYRHQVQDNPSPSAKAAMARQLMAHEAERYPGCAADFLIALALTYRRIMLDQSADPRDKWEILRRVYSCDEPQWMTAEIVYLHFVLLDQCRYLSRASASLDRKEETLRWIYTDAELEDQPFSFKNCVKLATGNAPEFGAVYRRVQEELRPALTSWIQEALARKRRSASSQPDLFNS
jgi:hypothetical protein